MHIDLDEIIALKLLLSEDELEKVLNRLKEILLPCKSPKTNDIIQYSARYARTNKDLSLGLLTLTEANRNLNRLRYSLISFLDELHAEVLSYLQQKEEVKPVQIAS